MGSPAGAGTTQNPANLSGAWSYIPTGQPQADTSYQSILQKLIGEGFGPGGFAYPMAQQWFGAGSVADPNSPAYGQAQAGAQGAAGLGASMQSALTNNPYFAQAIASMQAAGANAESGAAGLSGTLGDLYNNAHNPAYGQAMQYGQTLAPQLMQAGQDVYGQAKRLAPQFEQMASQIWNTAADPQSALYDRTQKQLLDQQNAINAQSGVAGTPYGAGVTGQTMGNFNLDWQNNLLKRMESGGQSAGALDTASLGALTGGAGAFGRLGGEAIGALTGPVQAQQSALGSLLGSELSGYKEMPALLQMGALPNQQFMSQLGQNGQLAGQLAGLQGLPYQMGASGAQNALSNLASLTNVGNQQYLLPQQTLADLQSYLGLGQAASGLSGQLGQMGQNQLGNSLMGAGMLGSSLFGGGSGGGMLGGLGSLFGGGGSSAALGTGGLVDAAGAGGGSSLLELAPMMAS